MDPQPTTPNLQAPVMAAALPPVPTTWPGAFGLFKYSREAVRVNLVPLISLIVISLALSIISTVINGSTGDGIGDLITLPFDVIVSVASILVLFACVQRSKLSVEQSLSLSLPLALKFFVLMILVGFGLAFSLILLIVPFFIIFPRIALSPYFMLDQKLGIRESIRASWDQTKGHVGKFWGVVLATIVMILPVITIIGIPVAIYLLFMYQAATVILYFFIKAQQTATPTAAGSPLGAAPIASVGAPGPQAPAPPVSTL